MSLEIGSTPILIGKDAEEFEMRVTHDLKIPSKLSETPKLEEARKAVIEYVKNLRRSEINRIVGL
jgi:hypothetical protein